VKGELLVGDIRSHRGVSLLRGTRPEPTRLHPGL
jgi:hypothetical protein